MLTSHPFEPWGYNGALAARASKLLESLASLASYLGEGRLQLGSYLGASPRGLEGTII